MKKKQSYQDKDKSKDQQQKPKGLFAKAADQSTAKPAVKKQNRFAGMSDDFK